MPNTSKKIKDRLQARAWKARQARDDANVQSLLDEALTTSSNCVDVGAHRGEFLRYFTDRAPEGRHVAVEALPDLADYLRTAFPDALVAQVAVAAIPGNATFYHAVERPAWSGLELQAYPSDTTVQEIPIVVSTVDDVVPDPATIGFVKIDVEGAELGVLLGMHRVLAARRAIVLFEHALIHARAHATTPAQVFDTFDASAYEVFSLDGRGPHDRMTFTSLCEQAERSGYGRRAETNWVARPRE